ncbi:Alternate F1F0 ATPase, F1 subunit gamma [Desulfosarcina cetonica]|uniref:F0F1 ATP synthase subunit gamma n=1 Tax=Desulfosarcina cetonica TaxID=90730 RepID=UPI0006D15B4D|nr:F0F1 ATP synthase subunit gamma [Desulfosarcina cetonica]VTR70083.1 Alternate F1F0 ATPase, F1 subunit gamma [Desulfosarcina cetonica]
MPTLETLTRRIRTAHDLLSVVKTMKSLAAVNIRQYERAVDTLEQYRRVVDRGWTVFLRLGRPMLPRSPNETDVCLVVGSDQGMCGQFNESLWPFALEQVAKTASAKGRKWKFWSVGEKVRGLLEDAGAAHDVHFPAPGSLNAVNLKIHELVRSIEQWWSAKQMGTFFICHHVLGAHGGYTPVFQRVLPLDETWADERRRETWPGHCLPMLSTSRETTFTHLFRQYLFISLYRAFTQSLASENAARLVAMQAAEKNILETIGDLQAQFREQRQAAITAELLDIVSGFEALSDEGSLSSSDQR